MKCECNTVSLMCFAFGFIVVSFLSSLTHYSLGLFVGTFFPENKHHYLVISSGISEEICTVGYR